MKTGQVHSIWGHDMKAMFLGFFARNLGPDHSWLRGQQAQRKRNTFIIIGRPVEKIRSTEKQTNKQ